jgi:type II secretory pathway pseudopilin PulG
MFKRWGYKRLGSKRGLILIELLIVLVILAILAGIIVMAVGSVFGSTEEQAYNVVKDEIQLATIAYMATLGTIGELPTNTSAPGLIDICLLLGDEGQLLRQVPDGVNLDNDPNSACVTTNDSYVWRVDLYGNVNSTCTGSGCSGSGDGYQGVWP